MKNNIPKDYKDISLALYQAMLSEDNEKLQAILSYYDSIKNNLQEEKLTQDFLQSLLYLSIKTNKQKVSETLINYGVENLNETYYLNDNTASTLLSIAIDNSPEIIELLLKNGVDVNSTMGKNNKYSHKPISHLLYAIKANKIEAIKKLIEYKVALNNLDDYGISPLAVATCTNNPDLVKLLLSNGADPNLCSSDDTGKKITPSYIAIKKGCSSEIITDLLEAEKRTTVQQYNFKDPNIDEGVKDLELTLMGVSPYTLENDHSEFNT